MVTYPFSEEQHHPIEHLISDERRQSKIQEESLNVTRQLIDRNNFLANRQVDAEAKTLLSVRQLSSSISDLVKSDTVSPTAHHRCDVSVELCCSGAKPRK